MKDNGDPADETKTLLREVILIERRNANELRNVQQERTSFTWRVACS